jgi:hypothetical protein
MKRSLRITAGVAAAAAAVFYAAPFQNSPQPVTGLIPSGALLCLEAQDFHAELAEWNGSPEKQRWLASARYQGFARSNLFLKLGTAFTEFSTAAGFLPDWALADSLAGRESALALYDIGNLQFLYLTRISGARSMQSALWQSRAKYEARHAGKFDFFVRASGGRTVAFAAPDGYFILATREEYVAGALRLLSGEHLPTVLDDGWYKQSTAEAGTPGDLRLTMNLEALVKTPQFRSYWIQRNASEIRRYSAGIADIHRSGSEIREDRVFLKTADTSAIPGGAERLVRLAPESAAFYRAWSQPQADELASLIERKIWSPKILPPLNEEFAPDVQVDAPLAGGEADLETRIDQPPLAVQEDRTLQPLRDLLHAATLTSAIQVQSGEALADGVFVETPSVVVVEATTPWTPPAISTGLPYVHFEARGNLLLIGNSETLLRQVLDRVGRPAVNSDAMSIAAFRHTAAMADYRKIMAPLDRNAGFFSVDLASLSDVFRNVREVELRRRDLGSVVRETVSYR